MVGATPVCLVDNEILKDGFYRTDIEFGRSYAKYPVFMVGLETGEKSKAQKFKGLYLERILDKYKWESNNKAWQPSSWKAHAANKSILCTFIGIEGG